MRSPYAGLLILMTLVGIAAVPATNQLELTDGTIYRDVKFKRLDGQSVTVTHSAGMARIPLNELPPEARVLFGLTNAPPAPVAPATPAPTTTIRRAATPSGYVVCPGCDGAGSTGCPTCRGMQFGPDKVTLSTCPSCGGFGHVWSPTYRSYGGGAGKHVSRVQVGSEKRPCEKCDGKGRIETREKAYCATCQGRGVAVCATCKGARFIRSR